MSTEDNVGDDEFASGFTDDLPTPTFAPEESATDLADAASNSDVSTTPEVSAEPVFAKITQAQYDDLLRRASSIDEVRAETRRQFETAFGRLGSQQQLLDRLQSTTKAGQLVQITEQDFEEMVALGYGDLAQMQVPALNRILSKLELRGTAPAPAFDENKVGEIFAQRIAPEREAIKREIRQDMADEALTEMHSDWRTVANLPEFDAWAKSTGAYDKKDRTGTPFAESIDARFVGSMFTAYKTARSQAAAKQDRFAASVIPRGSGGIAPTTSEDDEFQMGFKS